MNTTIKKYIIYLKEDHKYTNLNLLFDEAKTKYPDSIITLKEGTILWSQDTSFNIEQIEEAKKEGFPHQWGFGPCCEQIPYSKIQFAKVENINI